MTTFMKAFLKKESSVGILLMIATALAMIFANSPLEHLEHALHPWVSYLILPIFAFANAGISLGGMGLSDLFQPVPLGIMLGLTVGKLIGVYGFSVAAIKMGVAKIPEKANLQHLFGVAALCGVGFTMSLFIGGLAFEHTGGDAATYLTTHRIGILSGSLIAGISGYLILMFASSKPVTINETEKIVDKEPPVAAED